MIAVTHRPYIIHKSILISKALTYESAISVLKHDEKYPQLRKQKRKDIKGIVFITKSLVNLEPNVYTDRKNSKMTISH
jgi:hypothetical protein